MLLALSWATYDSKIVYHFKGPEDSNKRDFKILCDMLMKEAARDATQNKYQSPLHSSGGPMLIGLEMLLTEVAARLPAYGYRQINFETVHYQHGLIINYPEDDQDSVLGHVLPLVIKYNQDLNQNLLD